MFWSKSGKNHLSPPFRGIDTGFQQLLSTIYFWKFVQKFVDILFIPQDFGKYLFCWYGKLPSIELVSDCLGFQTDILGQFFKIHHPFLIVCWHVPPPSPKLGQDLGRVTFLSVVLSEDRYLIGLKINCL